MLTLAVLGMAGLVACSDPPPPTPPPAPLGLPRWSSASHVVWEGAARPADPDRLLAVIVDDPGGPQDRIAADADVATFLNDRFHAMFFDMSAVDRLSPTPAVMFFDPQGCLLGEVLQPTDPTAWIAAANATLLAVSDGTAARRPLSGVSWPSALVDDHPLLLGCPRKAMPTNTP